MTKKQILDIIDKLDAVEADAMGVSCRMFAETLKERIRRAGRK